MDLTLLKRTIIYRGRVFTTILDDVRYPSGRESIREIAKHPGGAVALAAFPDEQILLIRQHRYPLGQFIWELPAGKIEPGEEPLACAQRELGEETGYSARRWTHLTSIFTTPGFCDEELHLFLACELHEHPEGQHLEEGEESMTIEKVPYSRAVAMIRNGEIKDSKTICAILLAEPLLHAAT